MEFHQTLHTTGTNSYDKKVRARGHFYELFPLVILNSFYICINSFQKCNITCRVFDRFSSNLRYTFIFSGQIFIAESKG